MAPIHMGKLIRKVIQHKGLLDGIINMGYMKDNAWKEKKKVMEDYYLLMVVFIKDIGNKTNKKEKGQKLIIGNSTKGSG